MRSFRCRPGWSGSVAARRGARPIGSPGSAWFASRFWQPYNKEMRTLPLLPLFFASAPARERSFRFESTIHVPDLYCFGALGEDRAEVRGGGAVLLERPQPGAPVETGCYKDRPI